MAIYHYAFRAMGCAVNAQVQTEADGAALLYALPPRFDALEDCLSRFRPESELMRLNAQAGQWVVVSETLFANVAAAKHAARLTDGLFNPLVLPAMLANGYDRSFEQIAAPVVAAPQPARDWRGIGLDAKAHRVCLPEGSSIDLGGVAKGWAAQTIADELGAHGPALIDIGGDIAASGAPEGATGWEVEIGSTGHRIALRDACVVTSGTDYRRWQSSDGCTLHHLVDPRTGQPAQSDVVSATVAHHSGAAAEAYAKALLIRGSADGLDWLNTQWGAAGLVVCRDGSVKATSCFTQLIVEGVPT
jgi:thiamine biosynthesis lipoprotein